MAFPLENLFRQLSSLRRHQSASRRADGKTAPAWLLRKLRRRQNRKGEYHVAQADGAVEIFLHDFDLSHRQRQGFPVRIALQGSIVCAHRKSRPPAKKCFPLELEPELVTGLYEHIWQERRVVSLNEVPPLARQSDSRRSRTSVFTAITAVDPIGILRAMWVNLRSVEVSARRQHADPAADEKFFL